MIRFSQIKAIEQRVKDRKPLLIQSAIAKVFRDMGEQKISVYEGLNEIERIKKESLV